MGIPRIRDFGVAIGTLPMGARNAITDVPGVQVGHATRIGGGACTGVSVILPDGGNLFRDKVLGAGCVINGFGKSTGLVQVDELGTIETPIALSNTFAVGTCATALIRHAIAANPDIGRATGTVNPVVLECNDGFLNDIQACPVQEQDVAQAIAAASADFAQGAVGAGAGMSAFGLKGGIGSASRHLTLDGKGFALGVLVLANFGRRGDLRIDGGLVAGSATTTVDTGSVIVVLATDIPMDARQLGRVCRRAVVGLARTGSFLGHGSGDIVVGFTTAHRIHHDEKRDVVPLAVLNETRIDLPFRATAEAVEEAVLNAMVAAPAAEGRGGRRESLFDQLTALGYSAKLR
ncbi:MAG: P1 family peptidase [Alphaproteobacteria bacterium]|nr:P1 family peptidase [Alphaproteobacteria bacterium]